MYQMPACPPSPHLLQCPGLLLKLSSTQLAVLLGSLAVLGAFRQYVVLLLALGQHLPHLIQPLLRNHRLEHRHGTHVSVHTKIKLRL